MSGKPPKPSVLQRDTLAQLRELLEGNYKKTIRTFLTDAAQRIEVLREASIHGDREILRQQAHALKGGSSNFGAVELAALCHTLQQQAATLTALEVIRLVEEIEHACARVQAGLEAELADQSS